MLNESKLVQVIDEDVCKLLENVIREVPEKIIVGEVRGEEIPLSLIYQKG